MIIVQPAVRVEGRLCRGGLFNPASAPRRSGSTCTGQPQRAPTSASSCLQPSEAERISRDQTPPQRSRAASARASCNRGHRPRLLGGNTASPPHMLPLCSSRLPHRGCAAPGDWGEAEPRFLIILLLSL